MSLQPQNIQDLQNLLKSHRNLVPQGGQTKPALSTPPAAGTALSMAAFSGIIEYQPDEYTFTAYAGTPLKTVAQALAENGQYLPFDPLLLEAGATLGGTVAANLSGSGRYRYGGVRDFILGVHFINGQGELVRGGGKVVKNSAGFDFPKFMVGSLGRYGLLVDISFKVFPEPKAYSTLKLDYPSLSTALDALFILSNTPFEMDALDLESNADQSVSLLIRLGGLPEALPGRVSRLQAFLQDKSELRVATTWIKTEDAAFWADINALTWAESAPYLLKVPLSPRRIPVLESILLTLQATRRYTAGGNVAWIALSELDTIDKALSGLSLPGLCLRGEAGRPYLGPRHGLALAQRVKNAFDPEGRFLGL